uniref:Uncharacterized protein n=1 Tax=Oryza sativa subsp. japonica TaxID=39947 RepID=Q6Z1Y5_ORYSJ|nr:hypothetical protein [Oryza sativa Japonica Group]BAD33155.1 hypothetical protein [Oryza sativa Japonica Group]
MGRPLCCEKANVKKGPWTAEEDARQAASIRSKYGVFVYLFFCPFGDAASREVRSPPPLPAASTSPSSPSAFPDDEPDSGFSPDDPDLLRNRPVPDRLLVVSAGVAANLLFAFLIVYTQALTVGIPVQAQLPGVLVSEVIPGSVAASRPAASPNRQLLERGEGRWGERRKKMRRGPEPPGEEHRNFLAVMSSPELPEFLGQELPGNREN